MRRELFIRTIGILLILVLSSSCSTTMNVNAVDPLGIQVIGATVLVDGENIGQTPNAGTKVSNFAGSIPEIRIIAGGFRTHTTEPDREIKVGTFIVGLIPPFWPLLLWAWGPRKQQYVILTPEL